jgi:hypothetical protein
MNDDNLEETMKHLCPGTVAALICLTRRRLGTAFALGILIAGLWSGALPTAQAQDGTPVLKKVIAAYQKLTSYEGRATTDEMWLAENGQPLKQASTSILMQYKKPNLLKLSITTPMGDHDIYSDGKNFYVYDSKPKAYSHMLTAPTLLQILPLLWKQARIATAFDPLHFLSTSEFPKDLVY